MNAVHRWATHRGQAANRFDPAQAEGDFEDVGRQGDPSRYKSQITLARRRIEAFGIAVDMIEKELDSKAE